MLVLVVGSCFVKLISSVFDGFDMVEHAKRLEKWPPETDQAKECIASMKAFLSLEDCNINKYTIK